MSGSRKGFFQDAEGIDLSLQYGFENDYLKLVGVGDLPFMIGSGDQVVLGRAQGLAGALRRQLVHPISRWSSSPKTRRAITQPAENWQARRVGIPGPFGANYVALRGMLEAGGLTEQDIQLESIGFTQAAAVSEDKVDAAVDYAVNGPVVLALAGMAHQPDRARRLPGHPGQRAGDQREDDRGEPRTGAARWCATQQSIAYTLANPDEAFAIALKAVPEAGGDNETANRAIFDASLPFWTPAGQHSLAPQTAADWQAAAELMQRIGLVDSVVPADRAVYQPVCRQW